MGANTMPIVVAASVVVADFFNNDTDAVGRQLLCVFCRLRCPWLSERRRENMAFF